MPRPFWKGSINFGLVNIPVELQTAIQEKSVAFHMLSKDGSCRLRRKLICPDTGEEVNYNETARGVEVAKDQYVLVDDAEIEKMRPAKGKSISIEQFVKDGEIDPIYLDRPYFVSPTNGSEKAYKLLVEAMRDSKRTGVARFVMRGRQYLASLRAAGEGLVLHTLHYADEVLSLSDALPAALVHTKGPGKEVDIARQLIEAMTHPLDISSFKDDYRDQVAALIEQKKKGKKVLASTDDRDQASAPPTINLMDALRKSLSASKPVKSAARTPRRKSA